MISTGGLSATLSKPSETETEAFLRSIHPSKKDSIIRFKNNGYKTEIIANIMDMRPEEIETVIKHYSSK